MLAAKNPAFVRPPLGCARRVLGFKTIQLCVSASGGFADSSLSSVAFIGWAPIWIAACARMHATAMMPCVALAALCILSGAIRTVSGLQVPPRPKHIRCQRGAAPAPAPQENESDAAPAAAPLAKDVNFDELGQRFEISGGHIKSGARSSTYTRRHASQRIASPPHYTWPMRTTVTADGSPLAEWLRAQTERLASGGLLFHTHTHIPPFYLSLRFLGALASRRFLSTLSLWNAAVFRAAVEASLVDDSEKRKITMERLIAAGQEEVDKDNDGKRPAGMYT